MHVVVLGAGVVGMTTAYYLAELGCDVTVVDRSDDVARGASYANGGQLSYSFTDSLAKPGFVAKIPRLMAGLDPGSKMRIAPELITWGTRFLGQCTSKRAVRNTLSLLETAMRSATLLSELRDNTCFDFSYRPAGKLVLLADKDEFRSAVDSTRLKNEHGCRTEILMPTDAINIEPALGEFGESFLGAVYSQSDEVADSRSFVIGLREHLEASGRVKFQLGTAADKLVTENGRVVGVDCHDAIEADAVVVCLGAWSGKLLRPVGINPHIYPVRGYSVTLQPGNDAPNVSVTSLKHKIVFSKLNGSMRIAGFADFHGFNTNKDEDRISTLTATARRLAPQAADYDSSDRSPWGGFRPMTPSGCPCVGATRMEGLYLNTGHGMLGWTLACASGHDAANAIAHAH